MNRLWRQWAFLFFSLCWQPRSLQRLTMSRNHLATKPSQTSELFSQRSFVIPVLKVNRRHYSHKLNLVEILKNFFGTTSWKKNYWPQNVYLMMVFLKIVSRVITRNIILKKEQVMEKNKWLKTTPKYMDNLVYDKSNILNQGKKELNIFKWNYYVSGNNK